MSFWNVFFLLLIYIPLIMLWGFALVDIFRRDDMTGASTALWTAIVLLMPFLGTFIYLLTRPMGATPLEREALDVAGRDFVRRYAPDNTAQQLALLADLHERGKLTDEEFASEKTRLIQS